MSSRLGPLLLLSALLAALLSGCVVEEPDTLTTADASTQSQGDASSDQAPPPPAPAEDEAEQAVTPAAPHDAPVWSNGSITTGTDPNQVPGAWARQDVAVTNGFGDLLLGDLSVGIGAGSIKVQVEDRADYQVTASIEVRAASEQEARDLMERTRLEHLDHVEVDTLVLSDRLVTEPAGLPVQPPVPLPPVPSVSLGGTYVSVDIVVLIPLPPAVDGHFSAASGGISVSGLRASVLEADASSGDITIQEALLHKLTAGTSSGTIHVQDVAADKADLSTSSGDIVGKAMAVGKVDAGTSSGSIGLRGIIDDLEASTSSGSIEVVAQPASSGKYNLSASSGDIELSLPADGHAYKASADVSSGDIDLDLAGAKTDTSEDERHAEATTPGYDDAGLRTAITADASSGSIEITAK